MLSFGIFSARAAITAARNRGFMAGSGMPSFAATVISRASLPNSFDLAASCRPLRCMMFLNCEWPAMLFSSRPPRAGPCALDEAVKWVDVGRYRARAAQNPDCAVSAIQELTLPATPAGSGRPLQHKLHRHRDVTVAVTRFGELADAGPGHVEDDHGDAVRREHVEQLHARLHALFRIRVEPHLDLGMLEQH